MLTRRPSAERGRGQHGWLDAKHSFSFANYYDPHHMGFRSLVVLNEDMIAPRRGFGQHGHQDMEIITWILDGALEHRDSLGNGGVLRPGDAQVMTAGTGILHSEHNASADQPLHLLQIWIHTRQQGLKPAYDQRHFSGADRSGRLCAVASGDGRDHSLVMNQDAVVFVAQLQEHQTLEHTVPNNRHVWIQLARGSMTVNDLTLNAGDGLAVSNESRLQMRATDNAELLLLELS